MTAPPGVTANMRAWAAEIEHLLPPLAAGDLRDVNDDLSAVVFITGTPYYWSDLPADAHAHQARTLAEYRRFADTLSVLLRGIPDDRLAKFREDTARVIHFINREPSGYATPRRVLDEATQALRRQVELMDGLYSASMTTMLVPDTNALYWNTALDTWRLPWASDGFVVVLTPTVLKEIDLHKTDERRSSRREKAERFARQVGEYRRRGPLLQGANLAAGISTVMAIPVEPKMSDSLPWLDPTSLDDRLLASVIEVMRMNPHASAIVVTRDINFQNKLEFARVPFVSPEELGIEERP
jgi:PIN domain-containing protein